MHLHESFNPANICDGRSRLQSRLQRSSVFEVLPGSSQVLRILRENPVS